MTTASAANVAGSRSRLAAVFGVEAGEGRQVTLMVLLYFVISAAFVFVQTTAYGLFIEEFGSQNLPYAYLSVAILSSSIAFAYLKLSQRVSFTASLFANLGFLTSMCLVFWVGLRSPLAHWFIFLLPFWFQTLVGLANILVWHLGGHLFNVRQAKRLFGLIGAGNWLANILGGSLVAAILSAAGAANLYLLAAVALAASGLVLRTVLVTTTSSTSLPSTRNPISAISRAKPATSPLRHPYSRLIFGYTLLWWIGFVFIDNIFFDRAAIQLPGAADLATFLGRQLSVMGVIAIITTSFITSRVASRYGLLFGLLAMPVVVVAAILLLALGGTLGWGAAALFWIAAAAKTLNVALGFSISQSMGTLLFQPLSGAQRSSTQTIAEGIIQPVAIGLAGLILLVLNTVLHFDAVGLSYVFLGIAALWFWIIFRVTRAYPSVMSEALLKRSLGESATQLFDPSAREQLRGSLKHPRPGVALYALSQLEHLDPRAWPSTLVQELPDLLAHPATEVRLEALKHVFSLQPSGALPIVRSRLADEPTAEVYSALVRALAAAGDQEAEAHVLQALESPERVIRRGALVGILSASHSQHADRASESLARLAQSPEVEDRVLAAEIIGESNHAAGIPLLADLIGDPAAVVRHAAIRSAQRLQDPRLLNPLLAACDYPVSAHIAEKVLASKGHQTVLAIAESLHAARNGSMPRARRQSMIRILGQIHDPKSIDVLLAGITVPDSQIRFQSLRSLSRLGFRSPSPKQILDEVESEVALAGWISGAIEILEKQDHESKMDVLRRALEIVFADTRGRILLLLSFVYDAQAMIRAYESLDHGQSQHSPLAVETVDAMLAPRAKRLVLPLIEEIPHGMRLLRWRAAGVEAPPPTAPDLLKDLIEGRPENLYAPWTRLCAMYAAVVLNQQSCVPSIRELASDSDQDIREMSRWSLARLDPDTPARGDGKMLSLVEKVLALKSAPLFRETSDNVLAEIAGVLEEISLEGEQVVFRKGDRGDSLYVVLSGSVKVWDGERLLNELGEGEVFGELALLDPEPRLATVKTVESTLLLRLDEAHFQEILAEQPEVSSAIIRVITRYLRTQLQYARDASAQLRALESFGFLVPASVM
jgi:HEAT repeat protein/ATP/ADP translocase